VFDEPPFVRGASRVEIGALYRAAFLGMRPPAARYRVLTVPERHRGLIVPTRRFVAAARSLGCPVHVWTVDRPVAAQRWWRCGVAGIVTNAPRAILWARED
jgi:glycerophosphoryl diester phosphodiesterase